MAVKRFRTKPVEIEATQFTGDNIGELNLWTGGGFISLSKSDRNILGLDDPTFTAQVWDFLHQSWICVKSGQWIVRGAKGEFYPCDDETFHWKYEEVV